MVASLLNDIAIMIGIGMFLDFVLIRQGERNKISMYLQADRHNKNLTERFHDFLLTGHSIAFGRFFSSSVISRRFFLSAAVTSLASFAIVVTIQIAADPSTLAEVRFDSLQALVIIAFLIFNILFDYFTIAQTKVFIEAACRARSILRSVLFIVSDVIVTMNTFILAFAAFSILVVQYFVWPKEDVTLVREKNWFESVRALDVLPSELAELAPVDLTARIKFQSMIQGFLFSRDGGAFEGSTRLIVYSSFDLRKIDPFPVVFTNLSRFTVTTDGDFASFSSDNYTYVGEKVREHAVPIIVRSGENAADRPLPEVEGMYVSITGGIRRADDLIAAYTIAFTQVDMLEDGFPGSIFGSLQLISLQRFVSEAMSFEQLDEPIFICIRKDKAVDVVRLSTGNVSLLRRCPDFMIVNPLWIQDLNRMYSTSGRDLENRIVPFNSLMITSLLPTLLFYMVCLLLAICTVVFETVVKGTQRTQKFFLRAPLALTCVFLAVPLSLMGWI